MRSLFASAAALGLAASAHASIINGGFENPDAGFRTVQPGQTYGDWFNAGPGDIEFVKAEVNPALPNLQVSAYEGQYWVDLCGVGAPSAIWQDIPNLTEGAGYHISFAQAANVWGPNMTFTLNVRWNGVIVGVFNSQQGGFDGSNMGWQVRHLDVFAQAGVNRLTFEAVTGSNARGPAIDAVTFGPIPAPGAISLLAVGGLVTARRRR